MDYRRVDCRSGSRAHRQVRAGMARCAFSRIGRGLLYVLARIRFPSLINLGSRCGSVTCRLLIRGDRWHWWTDRGEIRLTNRRSERVLDKVPSSYSGVRPLNSAVRRRDGPAAVLCRITFHCRGLAKVSSPRHRIAAWRKRADTRCRDHRRIWRASRWKHWSRSRPWGKRCALLRFTSPRCGNCRRGVVITRRDGGHRGRSQRSHADLCVWRRRFPAFTELDGKLYSIGHSFAEAVERLLLGINYGPSIQATPNTSFERTREG